MKRILLFLVLFIALITALHYTHAGELSVIESTDHPFNAVGRVNTSGFRNKNHCTGTLVAPAKVLTAAHCVAAAKLSNGIPQQALHFVAGKRGSNFAAHSKVSRVALLPDFKFPETNTIHTFKRDIALLHLETPLTIKPVIISTAQGSPNAALSHILYARSRPLLPMIDNACLLLGEIPQLWITNCTTESGGSGGPVFLRQNKKWELSGVMVAIAGKRLSFVVPASVWRGLLEK